MTKSTKPKDIVHFLVDIHVQGLQPAQLYKLVEKNLQGLHLVELEKELQYMRIELVVQNKKSSNIINYNSPGAPVAPGEL